MSGRSSFSFLYCADVVGDAINAMNAAAPNARKQFLSTKFFDENYEEKKGERFTPPATIVEPLNQIDP